MEPGATYFYQVVAVYDDGTVAAAAPVGFTVPSAVPELPIAVEMPLPRPSPRPKFAAAPGSPNVVGTPANANVSWVAALAPAAIAWSAGRRSIPHVVGRHRPCCQRTRRLGGFNYPLDGSYTFDYARYPDGGLGTVDVSWLRPTPQDPAGFNAAFVGGTTVKLTWQSVPGVTRYSWAGRAE